MDKKDLDKSRERSREREKKDEKDRKERKRVCNFLKTSLESSLSCAVVSVALYKVLVCCMTVFYLVFIWYFHPKVCLNLLQL